MLSHFTHVQLFVTLLTIARQAPLSMGFSRQEYWSEFPCTSLGSLPIPEIEPTSPEYPALQVDSLPTKQPGKPTDIKTIVQLFLTLRRKSQLINTHWLKQN